MASPLVSRAPQCISCVRRMIGRFNTTISLSPEQTRGKKQLSKVSTVNVKLLQNIPGYGRRGSIIPATAGLVRNVWFPRKMAQYVPDTKLKEFGIDANTVARDPSFQSAKERKLARKTVRETEKPKVAPVEEVEDRVDLSFKVEHLAPVVATDALDGLVPPVLAFYRTPSTVTAQSPPELRSPSVPASSAVSDAAAQAVAKAATNEAERQTPEKISIYGSVSISDIAANLKAILAEDKAGERVSLTKDNISFVEETEDKDRVRHLGRFEVDIFLKGAPRAVRRTIEVLAQV